MPLDDETVRISDRIRYEHIHDAAADIKQMISGRCRADLDHDPLLRRALLHATQEIGEAASRLSLKGRALVPQVNWKQIVAMRNFIVHVYWDVNLDTVWKAATEDVPPLQTHAMHAIQNLPLPPDILDDLQNL